MAYYAWEKDGRPPGGDVQYWIEAECQLKATRHLLAREMKDVHGRTPVSSIQAGCASAPEKGFRPTLPPYYLYPMRDNASLSAMAKV